MVVLICVCSTASTGCLMIGPSGDLTLLSLGIKLIEFEFSLSLTTHTHTQLVTKLRRVNVDIQFPQLRAYFPSQSICSPHVADGQQRQEKCEFGAAKVKLVQPSAYRVGPLLINCSVFDLGL